VSGMKLLSELLLAIMFAPLILIGTLLISLIYEIWILFVVAGVAVSSFKDKCRKLSKRKV
jgi:hypothetical protein